MSGSAIADMVDAAADCIEAAHQVSPWRVAMEVAAWHEVNGRFFMRQVIHRLKERAGT